MAESKVIINFVIL